MKSGVRVMLILFSFVCKATSSNAQCIDNTNGCVQGVPRYIKFNGTLKNAATPTGVVAIKFIVYADATGGTPIWQEVQNAQLDPQGRYDVMLGAGTSGGVPMDLFTAGEPRWLAVQPLLPGSEEQPRVLMVSVPYALEAADAQTLGGLPPSAFAKAASVPDGSTFSTSASVTVPAATGTIIAEPSAAPTPNLTATRGSPDTVPKFSTSTALMNSQIKDSGGTVSIENLSNILFADRFASGVPGAVDACPASGCVIYAYSPKVNRNLGTIDPGTKSITIYLGPYTYTVKQITLRKGMKIIGMGASGGTSGSPTCTDALPCKGTSLQSVNGNSPVFVIPQMSNMPASNVYLSGFRLLGSAGNTSEDGFFLDASSYSNMGLWNSIFEDIGVLGFSGIGIHLKGRNNDFLSDHQWLLFNNVFVERNLGGGNGLKLEGSIFEVRFRNCQFDGQAVGDGTNIYIGGYGGGLGGYPISVVFEGLVSQRAATAVQVDGGVNILFYASHHEGLWNGYQIVNHTNIGTHGLTITDSYFAGNVGNNNGAGYDLNISTTLAEGIAFTHNHIFGAPDMVVKGINLASVIYQDNLSNWPTTGLPPTSGMTTQISPATSINIQGVHSIGLNPSTTPITTIQSGLGPGEMVTFFSLSGPVTFGAGGNIDLMGMSSLTFSGTITFVRSDLGGLLWKPVSQWSPPSPTPNSPTT
jgi:hypothetical protein